MTKTISTAVDSLVQALPKRPEDAVIARLRQDLAVVSSELMAGAIQEIAATAKSNLPDVPEELDIRAAIFRIYNRKVAEHAQMFPMFHTVETALRANLAAELETHYGIQAWWAPVLAKLMSSSPDVKSITRIGVVEVNRDIPFRMSKILQTLIERKAPVTTFRTGDELLAVCDFGHLVHLIEDHWSLYAPKFVVKTTALPKAYVVALLDRIREARNAVYHHQSFEGAPAAYDAANLVLHGLGVNLQRVHSAIAGATCKPPPYFPKAVTGPAHPAPERSVGM